MVEETKEILKAFSEVLNVNLFNEEDVESNSACGIGNLHSSKEECQLACDKWNKLANLIGWKTMEVYIDNMNKWYVCSTKEEALECNYTKAE